MNFFLKEVESLSGFSGFDKEKQNLILTIEELHSKIAFYEKELSNANINQNVFIDKTDQDLADKVSRLEKQRLCRI